MVGVVGSSPIAPTKFGLFLATYKTAWRKRSDGESESYDTANLQRSVIECLVAFVSLDVVWKSAAGPHFFIGWVGG